MEGAIMDKKSIVPVKIYDEEKFRECFCPAENKRLKNEEKKNFIVKRYLPTVVSVALFATITAGACGITANIVRKRTTEEVTQRVTSEMRQGFQNYIESIREEERQASFLADDASRQAAIDLMVAPIAEHIAGLRMDRKVTVDGAKTYVWGVDFTRLSSGRYGKTINEVLGGNIEGYVKGHGVRPEDTELARQLCTDYMTGCFPKDWTPDLEFAEINSDRSVTARSKLKTDSTTVFWRYDG